MTEADYYNLLLFLCPDFPRSIVSSAFSTITLPINSKLLYSDFIYSLQLCFYFGHFVGTFRDALKFTDRIMTKDKVIDTALAVHSLISNTSATESTHPLPPFPAIKSAFINVEIFENWNSVQDCMVRNDGINNAVGILPMRSTMSDHDSLRSIIPSDWGKRHSVQPTLMTLQTHVSSAPTYDTTHSERNLLKTLVSNLPTASKLLRRPSRQMKLAAQLPASIAAETDSAFISEQSSVAENMSTGSVAAYSTTPTSQPSTHRLRQATRAKLPSISSGNPSNGSVGNKIQLSNSIPSSLSTQVLDEQSSSDDASSMSSDADN